MTGSGAAAPDTGDDLVAAAFADALTCVDRVAQNMARIFAGTYTPADAAADTAACAANAVAWGARASGAGWSLLGGMLTPPSVPQPSSRVPGTVTIDHTAALTLHTVGFRAIGHGTDYFIDGTSITFEPPTVNATGEPNFVMVVNWHNLPNHAKQMTIVYEGEVTSVQQGVTQVCNPIRFVKPAFAT
jgi:hypothetical protein